MNIGYAATVGGIGKALLSLRKGRFTQGQLGELIEVAQSSISDWENDKALPTLEQFGKLAAVLKCSTEDLVVGLNADYDRWRRDQLRQAGMDDEVVSKSSTERVAHDAIASARTKDLEKQVQIRADLLRDAQKIIARILVDIGEPATRERARTRTNQPRPRRSGRGNSR